MMSENVDLVRSIYADWERGDFTSGDWRAHPEIEVVIADGPEPGAWTGVAGARESLSTILDAWEDWRPEVEEYRALDDERVLVLTRRGARGKTSGAQVWSQGANLIHVRGGKGNPDRALLGARARARRPRPGTREQIPRPVARFPIGGNPRASAARLLPQAVAAALVTPGPDACSGTPERHSGVPRLLSWDEAEVERSSGRRDRLLALPRELQCLVARGHSNRGHARWVPVVCGRWRGVEEGVVRRAPSPTPRVERRRQLAA
jgi:ketosteroid isomerase-like protein